MSRRRGRVQVPVEPDSDAETEVEQDDEEAATDQEIDPSDPVLAAVRLSMDNLKQLSKDILPTCDTDEKREHVINRLKTCMKNLIRTEMNHIEGFRTVSRVAVDLSDQESSDDQAILRACEQLEKISMQKINEFKATLTDAMLMRHANYKALLRAIQTVLEPSSEDDCNESVMDIEREQSPDRLNRSVADLENDDVAASEYIPITDPITKQELTNPVRNRICKHIYGKASILELIKSNPNVRCTTAGCSNRNFVKESDLISDKKLTGLVRKKVAEARATQMSKGKKGSQAQAEVEADASASSASTESEESEED